MKFATDIARGMAYLHAKAYYDEVEQEEKHGIVHRDLKVNLHIEFINLLIDPDDRHQTIKAKLLFTFILLNHLLARELPHHCVSERQSE